MAIITCSKFYCLKEIAVSIIIVIDVIKRLSSVCVFMRVVTRCCGAGVCMAVSVCVFVWVVTRSRCVGVYDRPCVRVCVGSYPFLLCWCVYDRPCVRVCVGSYPFSLCWCMTVPVCVFVWVVTRSCCGPDCSSIQFVCEEEGKSDGVCSIS
jgi:hypothetical protein